MNKAERSIAKTYAAKLLGQGLNEYEIATKIEVSAVTIRRWLQAEKKKLKIKNQTSNKHEIVELRGKRTVFEHIQEPSTLAAQGFSVFEYSNNDKIGSYGVATEEEETYSRAMCNLPYINYNPAKRIHMTAQGLYTWTEIKHNQTAYRRYVPLNNPDESLTITKYHDLDTLNATVTIADTPEDIHFTSLDACVVSAAFCDRFVTNLLYQQVIYRKEYPLSVGDEVVGGTIFEKFVNPVLTNKNEIKLDGVIKKVLDVKSANINGENITINTVLIESVHKLGVGDKLRSLTGLKVVIGDVRKELPQNADLMININQIKGKRSVKGSLLKEIQDTKHVAVSMRLDEIVGNNENIVTGSSLSTTMYAIFKVYDDALLKRIILDNDSPLNQLLESLHLTINLHTGVIELLPESIIDTEDEHYVKASHYLWDYNGDFEKQPHKQIDTQFKEEGALQYKRIVKHVWENLFIPDFVLPFYVSGARVRNMPYLSYIEKDWSQRDETAGKGKYPFMVKSRGGQHIYKSVVEKVLFPKLTKGKYLLAIPQRKGVMEVEMGDNPNFGEQGFVTIYREPVLNEFGVWCLPVKYNPGLPAYCVRVPPEVMLAMNGDFDGDNVCVLPYKSEAFMHPDTTLPQLSIDKPTDLNSIEPIILYDDNDDLVMVGLKEMGYEKQRQQDVKNFGGLRKRISFEIENVHEHKQLLDYAADLEIILKPELSDTLGEYKNKIKTVKKEMSDLFPQTLKADKGESSYVKLLSRHGKHGIVSVEGLLGFDTRVSDFWSYLWLSAETKTPKMINDKKRVQ